MGKKPQTIIKNFLKNQCSMSCIPSTGFSDWKEGKNGIAKHGASSSHAHAVKILRDKSANIQSLMDKDHARNESEKTACLKKVVTTLRFLARQAEAFRGHSDIDSNFTQLLMLRAEDDPILKSWLNKKRLKYTSPENQNEILKLMALAVSTWTHNSLLFTYISLVFVLFHVTGVTQTDCAVE